MISKGSALGLQFDPLITSVFPLPMKPTYAMLSMNPLNAGLDQIEPRTIADEATLADSVILRCQDPARHPPNLKFVNGALSPTYGIATVVESVQAGAGK